MELLRKIFAVFRGECIRLTFSFFKQNITIGSKFAVYRNTKIISRKNCNIKVGHNVRIMEQSTISATNGGKLIIGNNVGIGEHNIIKCQEKISIGEGTLFGPNVFVYDHDHMFDAVNGVDRKKFNISEVVIGNNCWIGANVVILKGTHIGDNVVIGAGCVIHGSIPSGVVVTQKRETVEKVIQNYGS